VDQRKGYLWKSSFEVGTLKFQRTVELVVQTVVKMWEIYIDTCTTVLEDRSLEPDAPTKLQFGVTTQRP
jgi:hypothetical protein